jgi:hypothetical protein
MFGATRIIGYRPHGTPPYAAGPTLYIAAKLGRVHVNFVGADTFLLVAGSTWLHGSQPVGIVPVSTSHASRAAAEQPVWCLMRNQTWAI